MNILDIWKVEFHTLQQKIMTKFYVISAEDFLQPQHQYYIEQGSFVMVLLGAALAAPSGEHLSLLVSASASHLSIMCLQCLCAYNVLHAALTSDLLYFLR